MRNLPDAGDGASAGITHQPSPPRSAPPANVPVNHHMNGSQTAKPHTKGAGLRKFEQLAGQLTSQNIEPSSAAQVLPFKVKLQIIWARLTELVIASLPR
jgi:hypothetical protein